MYVMYKTQSLLRFRSLHCLKKDKNAIVTSKCSDYTSKLCMDCKFYTPYLDYHKVEDKLQYGLCTHPNFTDTDIVTGETYHEYACEVRYNKKQCGPEARYYEKEDTTWILLRTIRAYMSVRTIFKIFTLILCCMILFRILLVFFKISL